jgi:ferredoxin
MRAIVDQASCQGHNRCVEICPEVFVIDDLGFATAISSDVPPHLVPLVVKAAENCPERAISTTDPLAEATGNRGAHDDHES